MFKKLNEDEALIVERGVFKPAEVYELNGALFVKAKGGFVRVKANGSTSHAAVKILTLQREGPLYQDRFGRLCVEPGEGRRQVFLTPTGEIGPVEDVARLVSPHPEEHHERYNQDGSRRVGTEPPFP